MKGMYSIPFEKRPKQLKTIQAAKKWTAENENIMPTVSELAKLVGENYGCIHERVKKLRKLGIVCTRTMDKDEKIQLSLMSRKNNGRQ